MGWLGPQQKLMHLVHLCNVPEDMQCKEKGREKLVCLAQRTSMLLKPLIYSLHEHQFLFPSKDGV